MYITNAFSFLFFPFFKLFFLIQEWFDPLQITVLLIKNCFKNLKCCFQVINDEPKYIHKGLRLRSLFSRTEKKNKLSPFKATITFKFIRQKNVRSYLFHKLISNCNFKSKQNVYLTDAKLNCKIFSSYSLIHLFNRAFSCPSNYLNTVNVDV